MPRPRTTRYCRYRQWAQHAPKVAALVAKGRGVSEAVRMVVRKNGFVREVGGEIQLDQKAFNGIRAAYYERRKREEFEI